MHLPALISFLQAFKLYDKDKDGYITKGEMEKLSKTLTKEQIEKVFARWARKRNYDFPQN